MTATANLPTQTRAVRLLGNLYLVYLGLLPCLATLAIIAANDLSSGMLIFFGGIVAVSVYLAAIYSYTPLPKSLPWLLFLLLDGPLWVLASFVQGGEPLSAAIEGYLIDGTAVWVGILWLALQSPLPTRGQRIASVGFMLIAIASTYFLFAPYFANVLWGNWIKLILLSMGILQATTIRFYRLKKDQVLRNGDGNILYIVGLLFAWIFALPLGSLLYRLYN